MNQDKPRQVILVLPPVYLDKDLQSKISQSSQVDYIDNDWEEGKPISGGNKSLVILHKFPHVSNAQNIKDNTFFVIAGFDKEALKAIVREITTLSPQNDPSQTNEMVKKFLESKDKEKVVDDLWPDFEQFFANIQKELPENYILVKEIKVEDIIRALELGFEKLKALPLT